MSGRFLEICAEPKLLLPPNSVIFGSSNRPLFEGKPANKNTDAKLAMDLQQVTHTSKKQDQIMGRTTGTGEAYLLLLLNIDGWIAMGQGAIDGNLVTTGSG